MAKTKGNSLKGAGTSTSVKEMKKDLKKGGGAGFMTFIPADGITVRFLEEPHEWFKYFEHYDPDREGNKSFPCTEDCEGCAEGLRRSKRYLVNAVDQTENKNILLVLPASLVTTLTKRYDKFGTIVDRDYELSKEGTGLDTEYSEMYESPSSFKAARYEKDKKSEAQKIDLLLGMLAADEEEDDDDDEDVKPSRKGGGKSSGKSKSKKVDDDDDDEDDEPKSKSKGKAMKKAKPEKGGKKPLPKSSKKKK